MVTGGTRGIGAAISQNLAAQGAVVAAGFSSNRERADELRQSVEADGGALSLHQGNVGDWEDCARVTVDKPISKMSVDDWHKVLRINVSGTFYITGQIWGVNGGLDM